MLRLFAVLLSFSSVCFAAEDRSFGTLSIGDDSYRVEYKVGSRDGKVLLIETDIVNKPGSERKSPSHAVLNSYLHPSIEPIFFETRAGGVKHWFAKLVQDKAMGSVILVGVDINGDLWSLWIGMGWIPVGSRLGFERSHKHGKIKSYIEQVKSLRHIEVDGALKIQLIGANDDILETFDISSDEYFKTVGCLL